MGDINALNAATSIMDWDQQTYMPRGGAEARASHLECLSRMSHEKFTSDQTQKDVGDAMKDASGEDVDLLRIIKRDLDLATKLPSELVGRKSKLAAIAHEDWVAARSSNDFKGFIPTLEKMFAIAREEAEYLGYTDHIYDALTDQYEEGATAADWKLMYESIKGDEVVTAPASPMAPKFLVG